MNNIRNSFLFFGLLGILGLLYLILHVNNVIIISARFRPAMRMYYKCHDMHGSNFEDELPNVKLGGMSVKYMYLFSIIRRQLNFILPNIILFEHNSFI